MNTYDLLLTGGHLIDPSQKIDGIKDVGFKNGRVVEVSDKLDHALAEKFPTFLKILSHRG